MTMIQAGLSVTIELSVGFEDLHHFMYAKYVLSLLIRQNETSCTRGRRSDNKESQEKNQGKRRGEMRRSSGNK
jgi:hypothetical protein